MDTDGSKSKRIALKNDKTEKNGWSLFWHSLVGDDENETELIENSKLQILSVDQIKQITKALSQDRKKINLKIEEINKQIDSNTEKIESLNLVGGDPEEAIEEIQKLNDLGQQLSHQLQKVNEQLKRFREREEEIIEAKSEEEKKEQN